MARGERSIDLTARRLPGRFHLLLGGAVVSNIGDGLAFTAFPLLAAARTGDPLAISAVTAAGTLPAALSLLGGAAADRLDRRRLMVVTDALRAVVVAGLVACVATRTGGIAALAGFSALIGLGDVAFTTASQAVVPEVVGTLDRVTLGRANGRLFGSQVLGIQLLGPALGGVLFGIAQHLPFTLDAASFAVSALLVGLIPGRYPGSGGDGEPPQLRAAITEGIDHVRRSRLLRTMTIASTAINMALAGQEAVLVILAERRLGVHAAGYGLLFASLAVGGLVATALGGRLSRHRHEGSVLRASLVLLPAGAVIAGLAPDASVCGFGLAITSFALMAFSVTAGGLRQAVVPVELRGRVYGAVIGLAQLALPVGAICGGALAEVDPRAPFVAAGGLLLLAVVASWSGLSPRVIDEARRRAGTGSPAGGGPASAEEAPVDGGGRSEGRS